MLTVKCIKYTFFSKPRNENCHLLSLASVLINIFDKKYPNNIVIGFNFGPKLEVKTLACQNISQNVAISLTLLITSQGSTT